MNTINFQVDLNSQESVINIYLIITRIIPFLSIPIYIAAFYCLWSHSSAFTTHYRVVLTFQVVLCFISDWYGYLLMRPVLVLPVLGIYTDGLLTYFEIPTFKQIVIYFLLMHVNITTVVHLLLLRLKSNIPPTYSSYSGVIKFGIFLLILFYSAALLSFLTLLKFNLLSEDQSLAKLYIASNHRPESIPENFWSDYFVVTTGLYKNFESFLKLRVVFFCIYMITGFILPLITVIVIYKTKYAPTTTHLQQEKNQLRVLAAQACFGLLNRNQNQFKQLQVFVIFLILFIPYLILSTGIAEMNISPLSIAFSFTLAMFYGSASTLALLIANQPYRVVIRHPIRHVKNRETPANKVEPGNSPEEQPKKAAEDKTETEPKNQPKTVPADESKVEDQKSLEPPKSEDSSKPPIPIAAEEPIKEN